MAHFAPAIDILLKHEGGYVDNPADPGGATNFGVSLRFLQNVGDLDGDGYLFGDFDRDGDVDANDIKQMDMESAADIYLTQWWERYKYYQIRSQAIATRVFSLAVHSGPKRGHLILQQAINHHGMVKVDGMLGPKTFAAVNDLPESWLITELRHETAAFYRSLIEKNGVLMRFRNGWLNRAYY